MQSVADFSEEDQLIDNLVRDAGTTRKGDIRGLNKVTPYDLLP